MVPQIPHLRDMLQQKGGRLGAYPGGSREAHYDDEELGWFRTLGLGAPAAAEPYWLLHQGLRLDRTLGRTLTISALVVLAAALALGLYRRKLLPELVPLATLGFVYNLMIALFAFVYDRYVLINYFLWLGLAVVCLSFLLGTRSSNKRQRQTGAAGDVDGAPVTGGL